MSEAKDQTDCPSAIQTAAGLSTTHGIESTLSFTERETAVLRELASEIADRAHRPDSARKADLWRRHNDLETTEPLVFADPENGWNEIITQDNLLSTDPLARVWEMHLRKELFWYDEMRDDKVVTDEFRVPFSYTDSGWGLHEVKVGGDAGGSYTWESPISDYESDFSRLSYPEINIDYDESARVLGLANEVFGDLLQVKQETPFWWTLGMTWDFINLRGLTNFMMDLHVNPEWVKRLMGFLRDGTLRKIEYLEQEGVLAPNHTSMYVGSGGFGYTNDLPSEEYDSNHVRLKDMWGFAESQETVGISPEMFNEFVLPFQMPILERFGLNCYGCCEPLDKRWEYVKTIPRLRRVSVSPWADRQLMAEQLGTEYILSMKPSPTPLAEPVMDEDLVRQELRSDLSKVRGTVLEIIMKDNHTLGNNPHNITRWVEIAREEIDRAY